MLKALTPAQSCEQERTSCGAAESALGELARGINPCPAGGVKLESTKRRSRKSEFVSEEKLDFKKLLRSSVGVRELCYFLALGYESHYANAAERLGICQSPLSKAIKQLEKATGLKLFARTTKSTKMTAEGLALVTNAAAVLHALQKLHHMIEAVRDGEGLLLALALSEGVAGAPRIVEFFRSIDKADRAVRFSMVQQTLKQQLASLREGGISAGIACTPSHDPVAGDEDVRAYAMWKEPMAVAMQAGSALADQSVVKSLEPSQGPYVIVGDASDGLGALERLLPIVGGERQVAYSATTELMLTRVALGEGVGLLSESQAATVNRPDIVIRPLGIREAQMTTYLLTVHLSSVYVKLLLSHANAVGPRRT